MTDHWTAISMLGLMGTLACELPRGWTRNAVFFIIGMQLTAQFITLAASR